MKAFVTGSTGLLGNNLVRGLLAAGYEVKAMVRDQEKAERLLGDTPAEIVMGDMENVIDFADALAGVDVVFHTAAYFREYYGSSNDHWRKLAKVNVQGTLDLIEAAEGYGVATFIHTSSSGVIKTAEGKIVDETAAFSSFADTNLYLKSKVETEQRINEWLRGNHAMKLVMVLPGWMFGPWDAAPTSAGQIVIDYLNGDLPGLLNGGNPLTDARDVALAMIRTVADGTHGERYILSGKQMSLAEIGEHLERITGIKKPALTIPHPLAMGMAYVMEFYARLTGSETLMTVIGVRTLGTFGEISSSKAARELGFRNRSTEDTLRDTVRWYAEHGYLKEEIQRKLTLAPGIMTL